MTAGSWYWPAALVACAGIGGGVVLVVTGHHLPAAILSIVTTGLASLLPPAFAILRAWLGAKASGESATTRDTATSDDATKGAPQA